MISRRALASLVLLGAAGAGLDAMAATDRRSTKRSKAGSTSPTDRILERLYSDEQTRLWDGSELAQARRSVALALLARERRLDPWVRRDRGDPSEGDLPADVAWTPSADRALTRAWIGYLARRSGQNELADAAPLARVMPVLDASTASNALAVVEAELAVVEALGGWRPVGGRLEPRTEPVALEAGDLDGDRPVPATRIVADRAQLIRRLVQSLDLPSVYLEVEPPAADLVRALTRFQMRHGLAADGVAGPRTIAALNEPVFQQLSRLRLNLARGEELLSRSALRRYVEVNIPAFELRLVEDGVVRFRSRVIVGDDRTPTPVFNDVIRYIDLDPPWYVPPSIVKEVLERNERQPGYLEQAGFVWRTKEDGRSQLIQRPGPENALGRFKFVFPNHHAVYLHDTAQRGLFGRRDQALSHGCVRVERPAELALALLADQGWDAGRLEQSLATRRTRRIELVEPVPIFLDYRTVDLDPDGRVRLLPDLYGHDRASRTRFAGKRGSNVIEARNARLPEPNGEVAASALATPVE